MKHLLKKAKISLLKPESGSGALTKEVHLIEHKNKKYILRRCTSLKQAENYEKISKQFEKYGFLPKLLERHKKDVFFEYIKGRDLIKNESLEVFEKIGKICAIINKVNKKGDLNKRFFWNLNKIEKRLSNKDKELAKEKIKKIKSVYEHLIKKLKPELTLDANDVTSANFRINKNNKVYFVDIEAIKPKIKGFGIGKFYLKWAKTPKNKKAFNKGYSTISSLNFLTKEYQDLVFICFLIQRINYLSSKK